MRTRVFTELMACHALWCVRVKGWTQTRTANTLGVNQGAICHVVHGRRFRGAYPIPLPNAENL